MNSVLVTGASGFVGRHVVAALAVAGYDVHAITRSAPSLMDALPSGVRWHPADIHDQAAIGAVMESVRPQCLVHAAWVTTPGRYWTDPVNRSWVSSSESLFRKFAESGGRRLVVAGTSAEYDWNSPQPLDEQESALQPASIYGEMKNELRTNLQSWAPTVGVSWAWARLFNVFGPHEKRERLVPRTICGLLSGERMTFSRSGIVRDFLHVHDAANAFVSIMKSEFVGPINVASGEGVAIRELVTTIADCVSSRQLVTFEETDTGADQPEVVVGSCRLLRDMTDWRPQQGWREGLRQTCEWWKARCVE